MFLLAFIKYSDVVEAFSDDLTGIGNEDKCGRLFVFDKITKPDSLWAVQRCENDIFVFAGKCALCLTDGGAPERGRPGDPGLAVSLLAGLRLRPDGGAV